MNNRRLFLRAMGLAIATPALSRLMAGSAKIIPSAAAPLKVRKLKWEGGWAAHPDVTRWVTYPQTGLYLLIDLWKDQYILVGSMLSVHEPNQSYPTLEAAKAAAQNHWEKSVLGALES